MYYLLYRDCEYHYSICDDDGYILSDSTTGHTYSPSIEEACAIAKVCLRKRFSFNLNEKMEGDTLLSYYPIRTLENPRQNYPELFI